MTSVLNVDTIADKAGTGPVGLTKQEATKGWVSFNGSGTISVNQSLNVSSLTDNGVGLYYTNWSSSFNASNYGVCSGVKEGANYSYAPNISAVSTTQIYSTHRMRGPSDFDPSFLSFTTQGDLA